MIADVLTVYPETFEQSFAKYYPNYLLQLIELQIQWSLCIKMTL